MKRNVFESVKDVSRVLLLLVCLGASDVFGQARFGFTTDPFQSKSVYDEVESYQIEVANKLRRYFDQNKFMIIVDVEERERETQTSSSVADPILVDTGLSVDYLPGLPFHPSIKKKSIEVNAKRTFGSLVQKYFKHNIQV